MTNDNKSTEEESQNFGRYKIISLIGKGGMGRVYLANDPVLDRQLAIKVIILDSELNEQAHRDYLERFITEARATAKLSHPSIVGVYDAGEDRGIPWIAFEFIEGKTLQKMIGGGKKINFNKAISITRDIANGLGHAHSRGIIHRDVKPANILIDITGTAKLADFGIAKAPWVGLTQEGMTVGSPGYMSPEQIKGLDLDGRSDLFSLGIVLYEMLSGSHPFARDTLEATAMAALSGEYKALIDLDPSLPESLDYAVTRCLAANREFRIASAFELIEVLNSVSSSVDTTRGKVFHGREDDDYNNESNATCIRVSTPYEKEIFADELLPGDKFDRKDKGQDIPGIKSRVDSWFRKIETKFKINKVTAIIAFSVIVLSLLVLSIYRITPSSQMQSSESSMKEFNQINNGLGGLSEKEIRKLQNIARDGSIDEVIKACSKLEAHGYEWPKERLYNKAIDEMKLENYTIAEKIVASLISFNSTKVQGLIISGRIAIRKGDYAKASLIFENVRVLESGSDILYSELPDILNDLAPILKRKKASPELINLISKTLNASTHEQISVWASSTHYWLRKNAQTIKSIDPR